MDEPEFWIFLGAILLLAVGRVVLGRIFVRQWLHGRRSAKRTVIALFVGSTALPFAMAVWLLFRDVAAALLLLTLFVAFWMLQFGMMLAMLRYAEEHGVREHLAMSTRWYDPWRPPRR